MAPTSSMDIPRPSQAKAKRRRRILLGSGGALLLAAITWGLARLQPAAPSVDRNSVVIDTVKRGPLVRQVHGIGTLVPEEIRWIPARTSGRIERIVLRPGAAVEPDSVILVLSNPDVVQAAAAADSQLTADEADLVNLNVTLQSNLLSAESSAAGAQADYEQAKARADVNDLLYKKGLLSDLDQRLTQITVQQQEARNIIEQKRFAFAKDSIAPQLAVKKAEVDRLRDQAKLRHEELDALNIRAGMHGVLQLLPGEVGAQVTAGANLARVADPRRLQAQIQVAETQAKDIEPGQPASIDTRNGVVEGRVVRIDPSVQNGTVTVDVTLDGALPKGARPDLSIDGTVQLERIENSVYVGRPPVGQEGATVGIFKLEDDGVHAHRVPVQLGRSSVNFIEVVKGLQPGDKVITSDMSQWDANERIKLN
ncbi:MAG TPA: HlyD family efflux transporter periplasmic adaptor subunit [Opitutaceae bacterium]|nr:HlyD family efflux transporter periplasmic adaptor subunit [Opitutaceae bacterium]